MVCYDRGRPRHQWSTALAVIGVAAVVSYEHASALVRAHGESGWTGRLISLTVDGHIYASSMVMQNSARRGVGVRSRACRALGLKLTYHPEGESWKRVASLLHMGSSRLSGEVASKLETESLRSLHPGGLIKRPVQIVGR